MPDPAQVRRVFTEESLLGLAKSLEVGQLQPILAYRKGDQLVILDGERRWRAARLAKLSTLEVVVVAEPTEVGAIAQRQLIANLQREDLAPMEKAQAIDRLMKETGWSAAKVAASLGLSPASVSRSLALLSLPPEIQDKVAAGTVPASTAYQIARVDGTAAQEELASAASNGLSREGVARRARKVTGERSADSATSARAVAVLGGDRQVTVSGGGPLSMETMIEVLEDLLAKARKYRNRGVEIVTFLAQLKLDAKAAAQGKSKDDAAPGGEA